MIENPRTARRWASAPSRTAHCRGWIVQIHTHPCFLWILASESIHCGCLRNFSWPFKNLLTAVIDCLNLDNYTAITAHVDTADLDLELIIGQEHPNKIDIISSKRVISSWKRNEMNLCENLVSMTLCYDSLDVFPHGCTRPYAVSDCPPGLLSYELGGTNILTLHQNKT